jgi:hypothetical protein
MPLARQFQRPATLQQMLGLEPEVGQEPSSIAFNNAIPASIEKQREAGIIAGIDARTNASMADDLAEAEAVRGARNMGFQGTYPLQEQANYAAEQKLRQILIPEQMKLQAAMMERETGREFDANQRDLDRKSRESIASGAQAAGLSRVQAQQSGINARQQQAQEAKRNPLSKLFGWLTGSGGSAALPTVPTQVPTGNEGMVLMEAPTGEQQAVPAARVQEFLAKGARVVE